MDNLIKFSLFIFCSFVYSFSYSNSNSTSFDIETTESQDIMLTVSGIVRNTNGEPIEDAEVTIDAPLLEFPRTQLTDENGFYSFSNLPPDINYNISVSKDVNHLDKVSTLDFVYIIRHILGIENFLDSPYKIIAADINADNKVNIQDLNPLRMLILGIITEFPQNESMRFLDASHEFEDPMNPWPDEYDYPYIIKFKPSEDMTFDFVGIKIGDVSGN